MCLKDTFQSQLAFKHSSLSMELIGPSRKRFFTHFFVRHSGYLGRFLKSMLLLMQTTMINYLNSPSVGSFTFDEALIKSRILIYVTVIPNTFTYMIAATLPVPQFHSLCPFSRRSSKKWLYKRHALLSIIQKFCQLCKLGLLLSAMKFVLSVRRIHSKSRRSRNNRSTALAKRQYPSLRNFATSFALFSDAYHSLGLTLGSLRKPAFRDFYLFAA